MLSRQVMRRDLFESSIRALQRPAGSAATATAALPRRCLSNLPQHRNSDHNNADTPWSWTKESKDQIKRVLAKYPSNYKASATIPMLWIAQRQNDNWIPLVAMNAIAKLVEVPPIRVYETCTFYTMFNREPVGKYHLQLCGTTPCMLRGAKDLKAAIKDEIGISNGETTPDKMFTLTEVECLGACVNAPMVQINDDFVEDLTPDTMRSVLRSIKDGKGYTVGPQNGRKGCMGVMGKTCLTEKPPGPYSRNLAELKKKFEAERGN